MPLRQAPKRKLIDYQKVDDLQKEIFGSQEKEKTPLISESEENSSAQNRTGKSVSQKPFDGKKNSKNMSVKAEREYLPPVETDETEKEMLQDQSSGSTFGGNLSDLETIAAQITSSKAGQGRNTTRPFSLPRTLIIDTTRLKAKFRTIDEQFTQNIIIDFLLREALAATTPENYKDLRAAAFEFVKRPEETTRRSLTVTEEVVYQMSELKAGINLETNRKYSNDEILSTLLALGVSWLYRSGVLT